MGFERLEDSVKPEDHEILVLWVRPGDLLCQPLFFCYKYVFSHLLAIHYVFSQDLFHFCFKIS